MCEPIDRVELARVRACRLSVLCHPYARTVVRACLLGQIEALEAEVWNARERAAGQQEALEALDKKQQQQQQQQQQAAAAAVLRAREEGTAACADAIKNALVAATSGDGSVGSEMWMSPDGKRRAIFTTEVVDPALAGVLGAVEVALQRVLEIEFARGVAHGRETEQRAQLASVQHEASIARARRFKP